MAKPIESFDAQHDAKRGVTHLRSLMNRDSKSLSPGQWVLAEELFDRVYKDKITGKHYAVSDYIKEIT